jgi:hypothetical protein
VKLAVASVPFLVWGILGCQKLSPPSLTGEYTGTESNHKVEFLISKDNTFTHKATLKNSQQENLSVSMLISGTYVSKKGEITLTPKKAVYSDGDAELIKALGPVPKSVLEPMTFTLEWETKDDLTMRSTVRTIKLTRKS